MSAPLLAIVITVLGIAGSAFWFGLHRRRAVETSVGVQSLANMKWRECLGLVLEALHREGYQEAPASRQPGDGGTEFLLLREGETTLLSYKHGTAYRLGEANVRDFTNGVQLQGAASGILVTLGTTEGMARDLAKRHGVQLIDGKALWPKLKDYVSPQILDKVRGEAAAQTQKGLWIGIAGSALLGVAVFLGGYELMPTVAGPAPALRAAGPDAPTVAAKAVEDATLRQIQATADKLAAIDRMTDAQRAERRATAAKQVGSIMQVRTAAWSTQSTLLLSLKQTDGKDKDLVEEVCRILTQYEELRYSRVQLEPPADSDYPVRWLQCQ